jgi:hypothetical protein
MFSTPETLAVCYFSLGLGVLINQNYYKTGLVKMVESFSFLLLIGLVAITVGLIILNHHSSWNRDWTVLITIVGWVALLKGISLILFPQIGLFYKNNILESRNMLRVLVPILLLLGVVFGYFGFL